MSIPDYVLVESPNHGKRETTLSAGALRLKATAPTDLWRKPPTIDIHNAPMMLMTIPFTSFHRARVTVHAEWTRQFDQGGLVLIIPKSPYGFPEHKTIWVKAGIEFFEGEAQVSVVSANDAADWSLAPGLAKSEPGNGSTTIEFEREQSSTTLWVSAIDDKGNRRRLREVTWLFSSTVTGEIQVGVFAARPTLDSNEEDAENKEALEVHFNDFFVE